MSLIKLSPVTVAKEIKKGNVVVTIVGLGWMGLPLACLFADAGARVIGLDINNKVVDAVNRGECLNQEPGLSKILKINVSKGNLKATRSFNKALLKSQVIIITVPTQVNKYGKSDYSILERSCREIGRRLQKNSIVILESTVAPMVTERVVKPTLEKYSGLKAGKDFGLAYSPIRAMGGRVLKDVKSYARIIGALDKKSLELASAIQSVIIEEEIVKVKDLKTAEASKIFEVIYRDANIALVNELAKYCEKAGIDFMEARHAANTQPYSNLHIPSIGVGGHCLPMYPYLLLTEAKALDVPLKIVKEGRKINESMPRYSLKLIANGLRACGKSLKGSKVTILGISYRSNIKETRFSPAIELIKLLERKGCRIKVYDPKFSHSEIVKMGYKTEPTLIRAIENADCIVTSVDHKEFKNLGPKKIAPHVSRPCVIVDCAHIFNPKGVENAGLIYRGIGRGIWSK